MSLQPNFQKQKLYGKNLPREVAQLEKNISDSFGRIVDQAWAKLAPTNLKTSQYNAGLDELVTTKGSFVVSLPIATKDNKGRSIGIIVLSGTVSVLSAASLVQAQAIDSIGAINMYLYISDGVNWWRIGGVSSILPGDGITVSQGTGDVTVGVDVDVLAGLLVDSGLLVSSENIKDLRKELQRTQLLLMQVLEVEQNA